MRVRTSGQALVAAGVLSGVLAICYIGDGRTGPGDATLDGYVLTGLRGSVAYLAVFASLHLLARRQGISGRWAYAGFGAAAALFCAVSLLNGPMWRALIGYGRVSQLIASALLFGAIMGFLYNWRAGLESGSDDPALLEAALATEEAPVTQAVGARKQVSPDGALVSTGTDEYFGGPVQVRTSLPIALVASIVGTGGYALCRALFGMARELPLPALDGSHPDLVARLAAAANAQFGSVALLGLFGPVPFAVVLLLGHGLLRAWGKSSLAAYMIAGFLAPLVLMLALGPLGLIFGLQAVVPLALSMAAYRSMAGLEPVPVKADIIVRERRDLVGPDHVRRQFGRLVKG